MSNAFDWNQMRAFLATVEAGSLSRAARSLGLTQPTLSRQIAGLEAALGVLLFERIGRRLLLTAAGQRLADEGRGMASAAERLALTAAGESQAVEGLVRITASDIVAAYILPPVLSALHEAAPGIEIEVIASNSIDDLQRRVADIAIRHVRPTQVELIARRCPDNTIGLYGARAFLDRFGRSDDPQAIARAPFIGYAGNDGIIGELNSRGVPVSAAAIRWRCVSPLVVLEMLRQGLGLGLTFAEVADTVPDLEPVLPTMAPLRAPVWLTTHREVQTSPRIRLVFDRLALALSRDAAQSTSSSERELTL